MNRRTPQILARTILFPATNCGSIVHAQEMFKLLSEKEIRAMVVGKDITDSSHWVSCLRPDGAFSAVKWVENGRDLENPEQQARYVESKSGVARLQ
jgi:hypothetical protein